MRFEDALDCLKAGLKVARKEWNDEWVIYLEPMIVPYTKITGRTKIHWAEDMNLPVGGYFVIKTSQGIWQPGWTPTAGDLIATDWKLVTS